MFNTLDRCWRIIATAISFSVFGLGGLVLPLVFFPIFRLFIHNEDERRQISRYFVHYCFRFFIQMMRFLGIFKLKINQLENLKNADGVILIANHPTLIDIVILISIIKNADCIVKGSLSSNPFIMGVIRSTGYISNANPDSLLHECQQSLQRKQVLVIFPEGSRTVPASTINFQRGAANIAIRCNANFLPTTINCSSPFLIKNQKWYNVPTTRPTIELTFEPQFDTSKYSAIENKGVAARKLTQTIELHFQEQVKHHD